MTERAPVLLALLVGVVGCAALPAANQTDSGQVVLGAGTPETVAADTPVALLAPTLAAASLHGAPMQLDGRLDEDAWQHAEVATDFVQLQPDEGAAATERSEVRVLYGRDALHVGFRAFDSDAEAIEAQLTRRDRDSFSDWVYVAVDSYNDRRTAYQFGVNPLGVKRDIYRYDDTRTDPDWDAVWDVATSVDEQGWAAEFRIPYSQLRFAAAESQVWGLQLTREIARKSETSYWAPRSFEDSGVVSKFGRLGGLNGVESTERMEIAPYSLGRLARVRGDADNPFYDENDTWVTGGMDVKYGLTGNFTLDATVNPDFGQVDADPARVNLSEFESFFPERRPFFLESANIFEFGIGDEDQLFHSRRIGRAPRRGADPQGGHVDAPEVTTIQVAEKLSGKTRSGWTIGLLHASTARETAHVITGEGADVEEMVEPSTQYSLARAQKDFRKGQSAVGVVATGVVRPSDQAAELDAHANAITGGFDFRHRFGGEDYSVSGYVLGSRVGGSEDAIARTQRAPSRYMDRPDADHLTYDPTRTSLDGLSASANFSKVGGGFSRYWAGFRTRTAEFETNDIGFMSRADFLVAWGGVGYEHALPGERLRRWDVRWHNWTWRIYQGVRTSLGTRLSGSVQFLNYWRASGGASYGLGGFNTGMLRGGPAVRTDDSVDGFARISSDDRKKVQFSVNANARRQTATDSWSLSLRPDLSWRPAGRARANVGASYSKSESDTQWVNLSETIAGRYVFGRIARQTVGVTGRFDLSFTPELSLQLYAQPFVSAGSYGEFKQVANRLAEVYADRFDDLDARTVDGGYEADVDGDGTTEFIADPDFNFRQFRSNMVLRWEYRPGSTLFAVWSQGRQHSAPTGEFDFGNDLDALFDSPADNVFMIKLSHWLNPYALLGG
jgi:hypothetical protein